jgi:hypothetical protein
MSLKAAKGMLDFDPATGVFTWKQAPKFKPQLLGKVAGTNSRGYVKLKIGQEQIAAHRLAWEWFHNEEPPAEIDHIDGNKQNNAIWNLRDGTKGVNTMNRGMHRSGELVGVNFYRDKWQARMGKAGDFLYHGLDFFEAVCARKSAENQFWSAV